MADDVTKEAALGAKHTQPPLHLCHHVGDRFDGQLGRGGKAVLQILVALPEHLKVHRDDRGGALGCFRSVKQPLHEIVVFERVNL